MLSMLSWLRNLLRKSAPLDTRGLFRVSYGTTSFHLDPLPTLRAIANPPNTTLEKLLIDLELGEEPGASAAIDHLANCFQVSRFSPACPTGITEEELLSLHERFFAFIESQKKSGDQSQASATLTDSECWPCQESPAITPAKRFSDSTSTNSTPGLAAKETLH